ncbi:phosphoribosylamine--glycine ligase [Muricoccus radiodurans]|uniref:phosphoribosylamine--glycine ligase n=1 Tax=Muricoccus radiodurans TaxID=2231721 RepID=UPI003CF251A2
MKTTPVLLLLLSLAACGGRAAVPESPEAAACRSEARNSPAIGEAYSRMSGTNAMQQQAIRNEVAAAERRAFANCMRARGQSVPGGGVEPERLLR